MAQSGFAGDRVAALDVELTNRCNARCTICPRDAVERPIGDMSKETFDNFVEALKRTDIERVIFSGFGEPLLHKSLPDYIARLRAAFKGVIQLNTNGSLLTKELSAELVRAGLDVLNLSYNGLSRKEYERVMQGMKFEQLKENVRGFLKVRGKSSRPLLSLQSSTAGTETQKKEMMKIASAMGVDAVNFYVYNNRAGYLQGGAEMNDVPLSQRFCFRILFIAWDGTIYPCSHDIKGKQPLGDVSRVPLDGVQKEDYPLCARCTICHAQAWEERPIAKNALRYRFRRMLSWVD